MQIKFRSICMSMIFIFVCFFISNINANAKTICKYDCGISLEVEGTEVFVYDRGELDEHYTVEFKMSDEGLCPETIYSVNETISIEVPPAYDEGDSAHWLCNLSQNTKVSCGNITDIPARIPRLTSKVITIIQIAIPVILVIMGSMDLFKGITAQKDDEIKKSQQIFVKRLIYAALIFFVVVIVKFLISLVAENSTTNIVDCIDCFISNKCYR